MKLLIFLTAISLSLNAGENLAPGVQYPKLVGKWAPLNVTSGTDGKSVIEVSPGHHYVLHPIPGKASTGLYHTTQPAEFDPSTTQININALHLVAEFSLTEARFLPDASGAEPQWRLVGKRPKTQELQGIAMAWHDLAQLAPIQRGEGPVRVALFDDYGSFGKGVPRCTELLSQVPGVKVTTVKPQLIRSGGLKDFDVVIFTGGSGGKQAGTLGLVGREQVRRFIEAGGGYVGICAGNYLACDGFSWGLKILDAKTKSSKWARGVGDVKIEFTSKGREILGMPEGLLDIRYANGPVFNPAGDDTIPDFEPLAYFRSELAENGSPQGAQVNSPAMVAGSYGKGRLLCSSPHPEQQAGMEAFVLKAVQWVAGE